jgi:hypothetical protein
MAELSFKICRVCMASAENSSLFSLLDGTGEKAKMLLFLTGIDVSREFLQNDINSIFLSVFQGIESSKCSRLPSTDL